MAVTIRLRREGTKNSPYYRVVAADRRSPRDGKFLELLGTYDPKKKTENSTLKLDRVEHWVKNGAQPSETVRSLIKKAKARAATAPIVTEETSTPAALPPSTAAKAPKALTKAPTEPATETEPTVKEPSPKETTEPATVVQPAVTEPPTEPAAEPKPVVTEPATEPETITKSAVETETD